MYIDFQLLPYPVRPVEIVCKVNLYCLVPLNIFVKIGYERLDHVR